MGVVILPILQMRHLGPHSYQVAGPRCQSRQPYSSTHSQSRSAQTHNPVLWILGILLYLKKKKFFLQGYLFLSSKGPLRVLERTGGRSKSSHNGQLALVYENST